MVFMRVPGGCYPMGSGDWDDDGLEDEKPVHQVCLDDFWMGRYVVTVGQYMRFCEEMKDHLPQWLEKESRFNIHTGTDPFYRKLGQALIAENSPVVGVSWHDAVAFAEWLSDKSFFEFGLPSEAQWEYAARSGGKPEKYAGGDRVDLLAWYFKNSAQTLHPVGSKAPNGLDLYDMSGNVCEWCQDIYSKTAYARHSRKNPVFSGEGTCRVVRGGCWNYGQRDVRCTDRGIYLPEVRSNDLGFRLVRLS
jgi:formylglycine-generating enzyme required for sulfatase activity